jgi:surface carbohydrate biosynthesis protein
MLEQSSHQPPKVDVIATFGVAHSRLYAQRIHCSTLEVGSTRNNMIPVQARPTPNSRRRIGFISNFSGLPHQGVFPGGSASAIAMYLGNREISARDYFAADAAVAGLIARVCAKSEWDLQIIGRRTADFPHERAFFLDACGAYPFTFIEKRSEEASYQLLDQCDLTIAIDSTLGYEMIARGARVLFVAARALNLGGAESRQFAFGFPDVHPDEGPFWTRSLDVAHLQHLMNSLIDMPPDEWRQTSEFVRGDLMVFDPDNSSLRKLIAGVAG